MAKKPSRSSSNGKASQWKQFSADAEKTWKKSRTEKGGGDFTVPDIDDGTYIARCTRAVASMTKGNKENPPSHYFRLSFVILEGDYKGTSISRSDFLDNEDPERQENSQKYFAKAMDGLGYDVSKIGLNELPALAGEISKDRPIVEIATRTTTKDKKKYLTIYVNRVLDEDEAAEYGDDGGDDSEDSESAKPKKSPSKKRASAKGAR